MYRRTKPSSDKQRNKGREDESGYLQHEVTPLHFSPKGRISWVVIPHPPIDMWFGYEAKRDKKLEDVRNAGLLACDESEEREVAEQQKRGGGSKRKSRKIE
jgi:hypothetical protein